MELKIVKLFVLALAVTLLVALWILILRQTENSTQTHYESIKLGDKENKVIIDDATGCRYIVFNNKTLTPLYDKKGQVYGCGQTD